MTTIRQLITDALRESGVVAVGDSPEAEEHEEALRHMQRLLDSLFGSELGEHLQSINYGVAGLSNPSALFEDASMNIDSFHIPENVRLILNVDADKTLYLHPNPMDGARLGIIDNGGNLSSNNIVLNGNGRKIEDAASVTLSTDALAREWFYRADQGKWVRVTDVAAEDESPLPRAFDDLLTTLLAFRLNPRYGAESGASLVTTLAEMRKRFRARYRQEIEHESEIGLIYLPSNRYAYYTLTNNRFNRGR